MNLTGKNEENALVDRYGWWSTKKWKKGNNFLVKQNSKIVKIDIESRNKKLQQIS